MENKNGSFGGGFASGLYGGMEMAKQFKKAMAKYNTDKQAAEKLKKIEADKVAATKAPAKPEAAAPAPAAGAEAIPVTQDSIEQVPLDPETAVPDAPVADETFTKSEWESAPDPSLIKEDDYWSAGDSQGSSSFSSFQGE